MTVTEFEADMVVEDKTIVADGVVRLILRDKGGRELPRWAPGSHIDLVVGGRTGSTRCAAIAATVAASR